MRPLSLAVALLVLCGCTLAQRENSSREWAMTECNRILDHADRDRCVKRADHYHGTGAIESRTPPPR
jgi:hypothetical protein